MVTSSRISNRRGMTMIEVLITILILVIGLLGLAGLQSRLQVSEMESYQRAQALILLDDMANRIMTNRAAAASYLTTAGLRGGGEDCSSLPSANLQETDAKEWCNALNGSAETIGGSPVGAMIGARGCVQSTSIANEYLVTVAWQGLTEISPPPAVTCGQNSYDGGSCTGDRCRRVVTTIVRIGTLSLPTP